ncbi:MAG: hypothetical protein ACI8P9_004854 [Parasphingorhabdus sp.]|jgi:hypothetical protein
MGLKLTLTDREIPTSPSFIEFLHAIITGNDHYVGSWYRQEEEGMHRDQDRYQDIQQKANEVLADPRGQQWILRSYRFFKEMLTGRPDQLRDITRYRFFFVIGIPRTGGTYVTKQLFRAGNIDYKKVQNALAHDGFPHLGHLSFRGAGNVHTSGLLQLAEYLTMVDVFFKEHGRLAYQGGVVVPKKFTKSVYYFDLIRELFGEKSHYLVTLRHPLSVTQSVLDKAGGLPENRKFHLRSAIERWALDDWVHWGENEQRVLNMNYVEAFAGYWKRFHYQLAISGIPRMPTCQIIPYGEESMTDTIRHWYKEFDVELEPETFKVAPRPEFESDEELVGEQTLDDVAQFWSGLGLKFPLEKLRERH